eukprot:6690005-Prymnesium_polylepis.2
MPRIEGRQARRHTIVAALALAARGWRTRWRRGCRRPLDALNAAAARRRVTRRRAQRERRLREGAEQRRRPAAHGDACMRSAARSGDAQQAMRRTVPQSVDERRRCLRCLRRRRRL